MKAIVKNVKQWKPVYQASSSAESRESTPASEDLAPLPDLLSFDDFDVNRVCRRSLPCFIHLSVCLCVCIVCVCVCVCVSAGIGAWHSSLIFHWR